MRCSYECVNTIGSFHCITDIGGDQPVIQNITEAAQLNPSESNSTLEIVCPPIYPPKRGYLDCSRPTDEKPQLSNKRVRNRVTNRPGSKCILKCPKKMALIGLYSISCSNDGKWVGDSNGVCQSKIFFVCLKCTMYDFGAPGKLNTNKIR